MRLLNQIKKPIFYAKYKGKEEVTEEVDGKTYRTGEYSLNYGETEVAFAFLSSPKMGHTNVSGDAVLDGDGVHTQYTHNIISETDLGLDVEDLVWTGVVETPLEEFVPWQGTFRFNGGTIEPWSDGEPLYGGSMKPWEVGEQKFFRVMAVQKSFHHVTYNVREL